ncbi:competence type IV pilus minor pilin ComGF [Bacillus pumilus]|uniref:competence type IV pilus minor pilin ComGF n=1 Tax=Bacillus pumilus TaxID=1408 RepID=UPI0021D53396|nr:competence type IV pilus minor pilin ComGF [Bacillus pumilus]MEC3761584.1 competence type IV pilus minor pilin ComGF [Bacillus pumilus]
MYSIGVKRRDVYHTTYKKSRPYAFTRLLNGEQGFTLVQALWQLQLFLFLSFGCVLILSTASKAHPFEEINRFSQMEWKQTVLQLDEELSRATAVRSVQGGKALEYVSDQGRVVTIEPYQEMLRKRMDQAGHLPLLQKVKEFRVRTNQHRANLKVTDESGKVYEAVFFIYKGVVPAS